MKKFYLKRKTQKTIAKQLSSDEQILSISTDYSNLVYVDIKGILPSEWFELKLTPEYAKWMGESLIKYAEKCEKVNKMIEEIMR